MEQLRDKRVRSRKFGQSVRALKSKRSSGQGSLPFGPTDWKRCEGESVKDRQLRLKMVVKRRQLGMAKVVKAGQECYMERLGGEEADYHVP